MDRGKGAGGGGRGRKTKFMCLSVGSKLPLSSRLACVSKGCEYTQL
jgi:hypothetical protein